jgi:hypothetical protein
MYNVRIKFTARMLAERQRVAKISGETPSPGDNTKAIKNIEYFDSMPLFWKIALKNQMLKEMDLKTEVTTFEDLLMLNPNDEESAEHCQEVYKVYDFYTSVYSSKHALKEMLEALRKKRKVQPPKCIFRPS